MAYWIQENKRPRSIIFICSECGERVYDFRHGQKLYKKCEYKYCPMCGIEMEQENGNNDN